MLEKDMNLAYATSFQYPTQYFLPFLNFFLSTSVLLEYVWWSWCNNAEHGAYVSGRVCLHWTFFILFFKKRKRKMYIRPLMVCVCVWVSLFEAQYRSDWCRIREWKRQACLHETYEKDKLKAPSEIKLIFYKPFKGISGWYTYLNMYIYI